MAMHHIDTEIDGTPCTAVAWHVPFSPATREGPDEGEFWIEEFRIDGEAADWLFDLMTDRDEDTIFAKCEGRIH